MKRALALALIFFLNASPALAAIAHIGDSTANDCLSTSSGNTLVCTTNTAVEAGNIHIVFSAANNVGTTDADHSEVSGVADSAGNTYTKLCEYTNGQGGAAAGATVSVWMSRITSELANGGTFTITYANSITSRAANGREFTVAGGNTLQIAGSCQQLATDAADAPSQSISSLSSKEYLFFRSIAQETNAGTGITVTTNYTTNGTVVADTGTTATSVRSVGEHRIVTGTGETSDPTGGGSIDQVSVFMALEEVAVATSRRLTAPIVFP